jgi:hypothetical protein
MSNVYSRLYNGSFKGIPFLTSEIVRSGGGRKTVDHTYPNSDRRFVEDLGKFRKDFTITAIIRGPRYHRKRDRLIKKLEESGTGILIHPFLGKFTVAARPYTLEEDMRLLGEGRFTLTFGVADPNIFPKDSGKSKFAKFLASLEDAVGDFMDGVFGGEGGNFGPASGILNEVANTLDTLTRTTAVITDEINGFQDDLVQFRNQINSFVVNASGLGLSISNLISNLGTIATNPLSSFGLMKLAFGFSSDPKIAFSDSVAFGQTKGEDDPVTLLPVDEPNDNLSQLQPITFDRQQNNINVNTINVGFNSLALGNAYFQASLIDYSNDQELTQIAEDLENIYDQLVDLLNDDVLDSMQDLRNEFRTFQDKTVLTIEKVITVSTQRMPLDVFLNQY